jgi:predicted esterase
MIVRGRHAVSIDMAWRLDGAAEDPEAPLVLCLHGMGMDEDSFAPLLQRLHDRPWAFLTPRGPYPVEVRREGRIGASWYAYDGDQERFRAELLRTEAIVLDLLRAVEGAQGLRPRARALMGFSQGGYCGSWIALRNPDLFSGLIVSGARVKTEFLRDEIRAAAPGGFRALLLHGSRDASVLPEAAERSRAELEAGGVTAELRSFDAGHSLGRDQATAMGEWLERRFA